MQTAQRHPTGLYTLFFTEMWERLSYYGMRALLVLFMVDAVADGGLGFTDKTAAAIYGLYTAGVYLACLPGGWIADRLLGAQRAVWCGGLLIATGHFVLGIPTLTAFFLGLVLVVLGTGLLKPNISAIVGMLYPEGGARRDAGFTIFYMGINVGAALGPLVCSTLGEEFNWHYGFMAAGFGMAAGLVQFHFMRPLLGTAGREPAERSPNPQREWTYVAIGLAGLALLGGGIASGRLGVDAVWLARQTTWIIVSMAGLYFLWALGFAKLTMAEKLRVVVIAVLFIASAMFWSGFEQAGSSLNLFAERYTLRNASWLPFEIPAGWFQSLNAVFVISLAPVVAAIWVALARHSVKVSLPAKLALGLILLSVGFVVLAAAAKLSQTSGKVWPHWLIMTYLLHTLGELCLSPVGLSAVTKLAPPRLVGQMMGIWFLGSSLGNLVGGLIAGAVSRENFATIILVYVAIAGGTGLVLLAAVRPIKRMMGNVE